MSNAYRSKPRIVGALGIALALAGCQPEDTTEVLDLGPCGDTWGSAPSEGRIYADSSADEGGDGSFDAPFSTLSDALAQARSSGLRAIALAAGEYPGKYELSNDITDWADSGIEIAGCGREDSLLQGISEEEQTTNGFIERQQPVFSIGGSSTAGIVLRDLGVIGGRRGVVIRGGAGSSDPIVLQRIDVLDSVRLAVLIDGTTTVANLQDLRVEEVESEGGGFGWGIAIQTGMQLAGEIPGPTTLQNVTISSAQGLGLLADGAWVQVEDSRVENVSSVDGLLGRGVQLQQWTAGSFQSLESSGNRDAAVFLESPGRGEDAVELLNCTLGPTEAASVPDSGDETAADGLVATQSYDTEPFPASSFRVVLDGTELQGNVRAHVLAEAITMEVGESNVFGDGTKFALVSQGGAEVQGLGGSEPGYPVQDLAAAASLSLNRSPVALDDLDSD